jgi:enamine deaminase RidA (YjgF/YER057c/UK114 family)
MFSKPAEPYGNDQHPFLYWNLYRFDPDGSIRQIGASGVKHAYFPDNFGCNCPSALVSFPQCKETYAAGTNDVANVFGPRGEIIPNKGIWGRCGSVFDGSCDGVRDPAYPPKDDGYAYRLAVREEDLLPMLHPKARYVFEYAYVIRDQANPELSMAHRTLRPSKVPTASGVRWSTAAIDFDQGPAINAWISPIKPSARAANQRISTPYGAFRVAASVTALTKGLFRYDYALLNEDFAIASTTGQEPNLRIADSRGLDRIEVHIRSKDISPVQTSVAFGNNAPSVWAVDAHPNLVAWTAPEHHSLGWGMLVSFSLVTKSAPSAGEILICSGSTGSGTATYKIMMPAPWAGGAGTEQCLKNIESALSQAGASLSDFVRINYVLPDANEFSKCWPVLRRYLGDVRPAGMMIAANLLDPRMRIEIEATAFRRTDAAPSSVVAW